jgi:adenylate cyclase
MEKTGAAAAAFAGVLILGHYLLLSRGGYAVALVSPLLLTATLVGGTMVVDYFSETKQRKQVERSFRHYLDPVVVAELMEHPERLQLGGERRELSVLFCDIRNFTSVSEAVPPERVVKMLNDFFTTMSDIVLSTGGLVDKFVGDQIMAFWGAPVAQADHAIQSCRAALRFRDEFQRLRRQWQEDTGATGESGFMNCGVGINTGAMVVGNIGSNHRFSYTVIGDTVNVAARLEALNKEFGTTILVGPGTRDGAAEVMRFREVDEVRVKGKAQPTAVYELLGEAGAPFDEEWLRVFAEGVAAFRAGNWLVAETAFAEALRRNPRDGCAEYYRRRLEHSGSRPARAAEGVN